MERTSPAVRGSDERSASPLTLRPAPAAQPNDLRRHFGAGTAASDPLVNVDILAIHETSDPEVIVGEFAYRGESRVTGEPFLAPCIFVLRVRDGQIVESRDYVDHITMARARGTLDDLVAAITRPASVVD